MKNQFFKMHQPKSFWLLFSLLFLQMPVVRAGVFSGDILTDKTYHVYSAGTGNQFRFNNETVIYDGFGWLVVNNGATLNLVFHTSNTVRMTDFIRIERGTINMSLANDYSVPDGQPTLLGETIRNLFHVHNSQTDPEQCKLNITGLPNKQFIIDGGANITFSGSNAAGWTATNTGLASKGTLLLLQGGMATLNYVDLRNNWFYLEDVAGSKQCEGGAVHLTTTGFVDYSFTDPITWLCNSECVLTMNHCNISKCAARRWGSAIGLFGPKMNDNLSLAKLTDCSVTECFNLGNGVQASGPGGTIRTAGNTNCKLEMTRCTVSNNKANCVGGGVFWEASMSPPLEMTDCVIEGNYTSSTAGGVDLRSPAVLRGCKIRNNYAKSNGGGLTYQPYAGPATAYRPNNYFPNDANITLDANTEITGNHSESNGGGMHINVYPMNFAYGNPEWGWTVFYTGNSTNTGNSDEQYKINIELNGATVSGNSAEENGGGIYMTRNTDIYQTNVSLNSGVVEDNTAGGMGGACYISSIITPSTTPTGTNYPYNYYGTCPFVSNPDNLNMWVNIGSETDTSPLDFINNTAANGGGMYVNVNHNTLVTPSQLFVTINQNSFVGKLNQANAANGGNGGGVYVSGGKIIMNGGNVAYNKTEIDNNNGGNGGGFYVTGGDVEMKGGTITKNTADVNGGGFYVTGGQVEIKGGSIDNNTAEQDGGGFYVDVADASIETKINSSVATTTISHNKAVNGGGAYINQGHLKIEDAATTIAADTATMSGGGIYMANGTVTYTDATMQGNVATGGYGGGLYLGSGSITVSGASAAIKGNHALSHGGGVCVAGGDFNMTGGTIGGTTADGNYTTGQQSQGGGLYMGGGTATISGGAISGNRTADDGWGGGVFMEGGSCTLSNNATIGGLPNGSLSYANSALFGGGVYSAGGTITVKGGQIAYNKATEAGGGIYSNGDNAKVYIQKEGTLLSNIHHNTADNNDDTAPLGQGGGIYALKGDVVFSDGYIRENFAREQGGGIYVGPTGTLELKGSATLHRNNVPEGQHGGGVYLLGKITVGETGATGTITAEENFAGDTYEYDTIHNADGSIQVNANNRNNVYLPFPEVRDDHTGVITVIENGISTNSHVGFSVPHGNVPVIYCERSETSWDYLHQFSTGQQYQYNLFDDTHRYTAVQYSNIPRFDPDHVYLYGFWTNEVTGDDSGLDYCEVDMDDFVGVDTILISTPCDLAYFISWVNGLNNAPGGTHPLANARLTADIDMSEFGWVPIDNYQGVFNGAGHTVSGIVSMLNTDYTDYGFFGKLNGGTVRNLYVKDASYVIEKKKNHQLFVGGIAGTTSAGSVIENCEASSATFSDTLNTVMGGLVGRQSGGTVRSSIAVADMTGNLMGGLVGDLASGFLYNSFANAKFTRMADADAYFGGLAGVNGGTVENCYVRLRGTVPADGKFGLLVGQNQADGALQYCYSPQATAATPYYADKATGSTFANYRYYDDDTETPYAYARRDNQVHVVEGNNTHIPTTFMNPNPDLAESTVDQQMLLCLNKWVTANSTGATPYSYWKRPTTKAINNDLPVLLMPTANAVYCTGNADGTENEAYLNYGDVNDMLRSQTADGQAIWLYRSKDGIAGNAGSHAKLYIDEGAKVIQTAPLYAYVGVTLDNSANIGGANPTFSEPGTFDYTDWHMFSTPLAAAPLGVNYVKFDNTTPDDTQWHGSMSEYNYYSHAGMPYYQFYDDDARRGYFPSHRYGTEYTANNAGENTGGNYYQEWDYYTYYEPEYHWINFKRNSNDHWHENAHDAQIHYYGDGVSEGNETTLVKGRGYLLATREETFLQCHGLLNGTGGEVTIPVTRRGYYSPGYNFLGNPYLAYLDFNKFAEANADLWGADVTPYYAIIDEDPSDEMVHSDPDDPDSPLTPKFRGGYKYFVAGGSPNDYGAGRYLAPHQGFMILVPEDGDLSDGAVFYDGSEGTDDMRSLTSGTEDGLFRSTERPAYPLVNLFATDDNGNRDMVTVELGRPDKGGARLMRELRLAKGHIWCRHDDQDWAIAFTQPGLTEAAIRFETYQDGEYTLTWNTQNGDFSYLHLVDNLTGADVDCLTQSEYRFMSSTDDYKSRFRLVFGYTGIDEDGGDGGTAATGSFAYIATGTLVVNGQGTLELLDVTGRTLASTRLNGPQSTVALPNAAAGVYLLRLTDGNATRTQKIVINQ